MDVTRENFDGLVPEVEECIANCDFISFDGEFTGLGDPNPSAEQTLGTFEDYYHIMKDKISPFQLIQVGLAIFKRLDDIKFSVMVYNFYIFPQQNQYLKDVRKFLCQSSSITFLSKNNFDFDKLFRSGIDYLTVEHENQFMAHPKQAEAPINIISPKDKAFVDEVIHTVRSFLESKEDKLIMTNKNGYYRKLFYQTMAESGLEKEVNYDFSFKSNVIQITRRPKDADFEHAMGFTRIIKAMIKHKKPLIGHNCFLDVLFLFKSFIAELSQSYFEFKTQMSKYFPVVFDTKLMAEDQKVKPFLERTSLEELDKRLNEEPFARMEFMSNVKSGTKFHDAGYDSYITGKAFVHLIHYLHTQDAPLPPGPLRTAPPPTADYLSFSNRTLLHYKNKVNVRIHRGQYINLFDEDQPLSRKDVFHLTISPEKRANEIHKMFEEFGGLARLLWKDDTQVFAILKDESRARDVLQKFVIGKHGPLDVQLQLYDDFVRRNRKTLKRKFCKELEPVTVHCSARPRSRTKSKSNSNSSSNGIKSA